MNPRDRVVVVTGASSGIGAATAEAFARKGARVVCVARREDKLAETVRRCEQAGAAAYAVVADVADPATPALLLKEAESAYGPIDVLVNNAGLGMALPAATVTMEDVRRVFDVNFFGAVALTLALLPGMLERHRGSIVNVTSVSGYVPNPGEGPYGATKAALSRWAHGLAVELAGTGVHVGVVSPGPIDTEMAPGPDEYKGKLYPPSVVAAAIVAAVEKERVHQTAPRKFGAASAMYPVLGGPFRWGIRKFTPGAEPREAHTDQ
jgi:NAD(P)-dependent dehydrogenase (short-subunit alcohol dehydrogenase family)